MICPVCKRELAPSLSICLTCGAMMNDTVREELETKIGRPPIRTRPEIPTEELELTLDLIEPSAPEQLEIFERMSQEAIPMPAPERPKRVTAELTKKETSPTLIDFQHKSPALPDWRLQLQNSIRKRSANTPSAAGVSSAAAVMQPSPPPAAEPTRKPIAQAEIPRNEKLTNALKRIEESRRVYSPHGMAVAAARKTAPKPAAVNRAFPFDVVERAPSLPKQETRTTAPAPSESPKPKLVSPLRIEKKKFDTNKLPPIPEPEAPLPSAMPVESTPSVENVRPEAKFERLSIRNELERVEVVEVESDYDEIDDLAPLSMRFGAAVFDLIIGGFAAGILLSPFLVSNANLATVSGFLAIAGAVLLVMFIYQTATTAFMGRTIGMKLFSLEIIDAEKNETPTLHQAAVNSAVYLLSLLLCGIGFLPAFFNEERRTVHDILSGTLLIREY